MTNKEELLNPAAIPNSAVVKGLKRVNKIPLFIGLSVAGIILILFFYTIMSKSHKNAPTPPVTEESVTYSSSANSLLAGIGNGVIEPDKPKTPPTPPVESTPSAPQAHAQAIANKPASLATPPLPGQANSPLQAQSGLPSGEEECDQICQIKQEMLQRAVTGGTTVQYNAPKAATQNFSNAPTSRQEMLDRISAVRSQLAAENQGSDDPNVVYQQELAKVKAQQGNNDTSGSGAPALLNIGGDAAPSNSSTDAAYNQFSGTSDRWKLNSVKKAPASPYELRTGTVLPATLISGVNSDLPGTLNAQVSQNVYDTATGKHLLIPQGSRLIGSYSSNVIYGQKRVLIAWQRIIFPDGGSLDLGSMPGADSAGYSGFSDKVNNHFFRIFGSALLMSGITATVAYSQDDHSSSSNNNDDDDNSFSSEMSRALGQQLGQATAQIIMKNLNIAPTLEIRPGYQFNVIVTKDLVFSKPYRAFEY